MKILDRYIAKNFLYGYFISLFVMLGLFLTVDLFLNLDEFAEYLESTNPATGQAYSYGEVGLLVMRYYAVRCCLWYRDLAGMVMVIAAVFSLTRMTRNNELIAVMASGVSLKRILAPILFLSLLLSGLMVLDQELVIPKLSHELTRSHDDMMEESVYDLWFAGDDKGSLISTGRYEEKTQTLYDPLIILREKIAGREEVYRVTGKIQAAEAVYDAQRRGWVLTEGQLLRLPVAGQAVSSQRPSPVTFYPSNLTATDIPIRRREGFKELLSLRQLTELERNAGARKTDLAELALQKNSRITDPIINLIMLMVALPVLVCRDPKSMKTAIGISFLTTASCFVLVFVCKLFATEIIFGQIRPALWTWLPIFIFFPIAWIEIDSMRT
jgi:lipopolysaccharide export system permease protein